MGDFGDGCARTRVWVGVGQREKNDLLEELMLLPENAVVRRINELVKRARSVKVHAYIIHYLRKQMPYMMGKQEKQVRRWGYHTLFVCLFSSRRCSVVLCCVVP